MAGRFVGHAEPTSSTIAVCPWDQVVNDPEQIHKSRAGQDYWLSQVRMRVYACACVCACVCVRACELACVRACVRV